MSDQRYAPPMAALAEPALRSGGGGLIDIGEAFRQAWGAVWPNLGLLLGASIVSGLVALLSACTLIGVVVVWPVLWWGWWRLLLNVLDGEGEVRDLFSGFESYRENLSGMLNLSGLMLVIMLAGQSVSHLGQVVHSMPLMVLGTVASMGWSIGVMPRLSFVWYFLVDQRLTPSEAVRASWDATANQLGLCFLLGLVSGLTTMLGFLFLIVGVIPAAFVASLMQAAAYRQLAGR